MIPSLAVEPIELFTTTDAAVSGSNHWPWIVGVALAAVAFASLSTWIWWRSGPRAAPPERAFIGLCRRFRLGADHRETIGSLAASSGTPAVALIICEGAFSKAVALLEGQRQDQGKSITVFERKRLLEIQHRLFR